MLKDNSFLNNLGEYCVDELKKIGATNSEVIVAHSISEDMLQRNGKIEEVVRSEDISIGLTAYIGQKKSGGAPDKVLLPMSTDLASMRDECRADS